MLRNGYNNIRNNNCNNSSSTKITVRNKARKRSSYTIGKEEHNINSNIIFIFKPITILTRIVLMRFSCSTHIKSGFNK
ncbi:unnamed protein product, partial [Ceratitis capitata]